MPEEITQYEFIRCERIWLLYLCELNWEQKAVNPLDAISDKFSPQLSDLLIRKKYIGQSQDFYLKKSDDFSYLLGKRIKAHPKNLILKN
tara:strand:- start:14933 stop:15199 length:267 start_codon:yes stop_codon:yes gene_type:complete